MKLGVWVLASMLGVIGCQRGPGEAGGAADGASVGRERGACRPDRSCEPGLLCLSERCVRPPAADCRVVGNQVASLELGNYAPVETRAPTIAKYQAACERAFVSKEQGACLAQATDRWSAAQCAPAMFPDVKASAGGDCEQIAATIRTAVSRQMGGGITPEIKAMFAKVVAVMQQSCEQDGWPDAFKQCILTNGDTTAALETCNGQMPAGLQQKLAERMTAATAR